MDLAAIRPKSTSVILNPSLPVILSECEGSHILHRLVAEILRLAPQNDIR
jgi:hypothetical protein